MKLSELSSGQAVLLIKLLKKKEKLETQLAAVESRLGKLSSGKVSALAAKSPARPKSKGPRAKRGALKKQVLALLKSAGKKGLPVKVLAKKLKTTSPRLFTWFYTTGENVPGLKKSGRGCYAYLPKK
ncbi:MAG: hypothetical protein PHD76_13695 [Methylacidiphilales bacterium]|nr:hypothetical protein [Candidatus Methylacidiphilales bacterium]